MVTVNMQLSARSVGLFEAFYNSLKPITIIDLESEIEKSGKIKGSKEYPFEFKLTPLEGAEIYESYHGVYVNIQYTLKADLTGSFFGKNLTKTLEFIVENELTIPPLAPSPERFSIDQTSLDQKEGTPISDFLIKGSLETTTCSIIKPLIGSISVEKCDLVLKSIEIQLIRVETCGCTDGFAKENTEIQGIQIVEGDIPRTWEIPIYMLFPRLFTCPSIGTPTFKIDFEVNISVLFEDGNQLSHKIPIKLIRM